MLENPFAFGHLWLAADALLDGAAEVTLVGPRAGVRELLAVLNQRYLPTVAVAVRPDGALPPVLAEGMEGRVAVGGAATAYVCRHFACELPVTSAEALGRRLDPAVFQKA